MNNTRAYCVGSGIASLSAACYLIKEGRLDGKNITIFEESEKFGGSLEALWWCDEQFIGEVQRGSLILTKVYNIG